MSNYPLCVSCKWCMKVKGTILDRLFGNYPKLVCTHPNCLKSPVDATSEFAETCYDARRYNYRCHYEGKYYEPKDTVATLDNLHK